MLRLDLRKLLDIVAFEKARPLLLETWGFGDAGGLVLGSGGLNRWSTYINTNVHITIYCEISFIFKKIYNIIIQHRFTGTFGSLFPRLIPHILLSCFLGFRIYSFFFPLSQSKFTRGDGRNDGAASRPDGPARPIVTVALFWGAPGTGKSAAAEALGFEFGRVPQQQVALQGSRLRILGVLGAGP